MAALLSLCMRVFKYCLAHAQYNVRIKAAPLHGNYTLIVETRLPHLLNLHTDYSENRVMQKRMLVLRDTQARMILPNGSPCIVALFWAQVANGFIAMALQGANV